MKLLKFEFDKSRLSTIPPNECIFFIQATWVLNELNTLLRCLWFSYYSEKIENENINKAQILQTLFFVRTLAGKLHGAWEMTQKGFFGSKLSKIYEPLLSNVCGTDISELKNYFSKPNLISLVRCTYSAHYNIDFIEKLLRSELESEKYEMFIHKLAINCKYDICEDWMISAIRDVSKCSDNQTALKKLIDEVIQITQNFTSFLNHFISFVAEKYFGHTYTEIDIPDPSKTAIIPSFVSEEFKEYKE